MTANTQNNIVKTTLQYLTSGALLMLCVLILWPFYGKYIDPDAVSYLTLAKDYLEGDSANAINAYWSPLGVWGCVLVAKITLLPLFTAAIIFNAIGALAALWAGQALLLHFRESLVERLGYVLSMPFFWAYVVYMQSFTDVWQIAFLLLTLNILLQNNFEKKWLYWLLAAVTGALSFFGKAYSFYFFPIMLLIIPLTKQYVSGKLNFKKSLQIFAVGEITFLMLIFPWLYLIHQKYGFWTVSTAGSLNMSWGLEGTYNTREGIDILMPPPNYESLFFFEDPYYFQDEVVHFWDSPKMFLKLLARAGYNALLWFKSCSNLSVFYFFIWLFFALSLFFKNQWNSLFEEKKKYIVLIPILLIYPLPFLLLNFDEGRYLWFTVPLSLALGLLLFDILFKILPTKFKTIFITIFFLSYLTHPILVLKEHFNAGKTEFMQAQLLKEQGIRGAFVTNLAYENGKTTLPVLTWFSENPWYCHSLDIYTPQQILKDAKRYDIKYYFYFYKTEKSDFELSDEGGKSYPEISQGKIPGMKVFKLSE